MGYNNNGYRGNNNGRSNRGGFGGGRSVRGFRNMAEAETFIRENSGFKDEKNRRRQKFEKNRRQDDDEYEHEDW